MMYSILGIFLISLTHTEVVLSYKSIRESCNPFDKGHPEDTKPSCFSSQDAASFTDGCHVTVNAPDLIPSSKCGHRPKLSKITLRAHNPGHDMEHQPVVANSTTSTVHKADKSLFSTAQGVGPQRDSDNGVMGVYDQEQEIAQLMLDPKWAELQLRLNRSLHNKDPIARILHPPMRYRLMSAGGDVLQPRQVHHWSSIVEESSALRLLDYGDGWPFIEPGPDVTVFRATCPVSGAAVCIKACKVEMDEDEDSMIELMNELQLQAKAIDATAPLVYGYYKTSLLTISGKVVPGLVMVMELVKGPPLKEVIRKLHSEDEVREGLVVPLLKALARLHSLGIVHRDIKPENIHLQGDNITEGLRLLDYGLSEEFMALDEDTGETYRLELEQYDLGTNAYMAPELWEDINEPGFSYTEAVDVWAAGIIFYEALMGHHPYLHRNFKDKAVRKALNGLLKQRREISYEGRPLSVECLDFLQCCLQVYYPQRWNVFDLLEHPWVKKGIN